MMMKKTVCFAILLTLSVLLSACGTAPKSEVPTDDLLPAAEDSVAPAESGEDSAQAPDVDPDPLLPDDNPVTPFSCLTAPVPSNIGFAHLNDGDTVETCTEFAVDGTVGNQRRFYIIRVAVLNPANAPEIGKAIYIEVLNTDYAYIDHVRLTGMGFVAATKTGIAVYRILTQNNRTTFRADYTEYTVSDTGSRGERLDQVQLVTVTGKSMTGSVGNAMEIASCRTDFIEFSFTAADKLGNYRSQSVIPVICLACTPDSCRVYTADNAPEITDEMLERIQNYTVDRLLKDLQPSGD
ncbi:MAG: hypothetical protein NC131_18285 [Roseburia sp.]|nr:hypothetical protein [Roseburia sp.]